MILIDFIHKLGHLFRKQGDNLDFEIMELEKVKKIMEAEPIVIEKEATILLINDAMEVSESRTETAAAVVEVEEIKVVTKLTM
jgi:DNA polymerase-3 subunit alpha